MPGLFACCAGLGRRPRGGDQFLRDPRDAVEGCPFCAISRGAEQHRVVFQDERLVVFHSIRPQATLHLLVTPRHHIANTDSLGRDDAELAAEMERVGRDTLRRLGAPAGGNGANGSAGGNSSGSGTAGTGDVDSGLKFGYHVPPWRSVDHLHLHAMALPHSPAWAALKYMLPGVWLSSEALIARLRRGEPPGAPAGRGEADEEAGPAAA